MDKTETLDLGIQDMNTENKKTLWITVAIIAVIVIIVLVISLYIGLSASAPKGPKGSPTQKNVNLIDEKIGSKPENEVGLKPLTAEGYENSWQTANAENFRQAAKLANVKWYNTESASAIPSDVRGMSFIKEGFKGSLSGFGRPGSLNPQYGFTPSSTEGDGGVIQTYPVGVKPVDSVGKAALANAKASVEVTAAAVEMDLNRTGDGTSVDASAGAKAVRASMPPGYKRGDIVAKGGLLETSTPIPVVIVDGKEVLVPGITGLDYYDHFASTALTGGSVDRYARDRSNPNQRGKQYPLSGSYNSKSYYGINPYKKGATQVVSFGNTPVGYADTAVSSYNTDGNLDGNSGEGPVTNEDYERIAEACKSRGLTGNALQECQTDSGMAGVNTAYSRNDLVGAYRGYEDSFLLADGVDVSGSFAHKLTASATIAETAEIEYKEDVKKNASISVMNSSDICDPLVIYKQFIGLVDEDDDDTTPESHRVVP